MIATNHHKKGGVAIWVSVAIALILLLLVPGVAIGTALAYVKNHTGSMDNSAMLSGANGSLSYPQGIDIEDAGKHIDDYLKKKKTNSPLVGKGKNIVEASQKYNINPAFLVAIAGQESSFGTDNGGNPNKENYFNTKCSSKMSGSCVGGYQHFASIEVAIDEHASLLNRVYFSQGLNTIEKIQKRYCPTKDGPLCGQHWIVGVTKIFNEVIEAYPSLNVPESSGFGPEITGSFYPPLGKAKAISYNRTSHGAAGHGVFGVKIFGGSFQNVSDGAIDYNFGKGSQNPVYATFDGTVVGTTQVHHSTYGKGAGVLWLKSSDGNNGGIYAHITFDSNIKVGSDIKKGQKIGTVAPNCSVKSINQCVTFNGSDHLHFQFYINKKGLNKKQLIGLFP